MITADELKIREFKSTDEELVQSFFDNMGPESVRFFNRNGGNTRTALQAVRGELENAKFWMAEEMTENGPKMAGYVFLWDLNKSIPWFGIAVADEWKGRRLGTKLIRHAIDYCKDNAYGGILLTTVIENIAAQKLYEKNGFENQGIYKNNIEYTYVLRFDR